MRVPAPQYNGFTLLEMLVVIAVMSLIAAIGFPAIARGIERSEFRAASSALDLAVRQARASAIGGGAPVRLRFRPDAAERELLGDMARQSLTPLQIAMPDAGIMFFSDGSSSGGTITLTGRSQSYRLHIDAANGAMKVAP